MTVFAGAIAFRPDARDRLPASFALPAPDHGQPEIWRSDAAIFASWPAGRDISEDAVFLCAARLDAVERLAGELGLDSRGDDRALLIAAYLRWGEAFVDHVTGEYAFAAWSAKRNRLFLARDAMGGRPIHYHLAGDRILFATEVRTLTAVPGVSGGLALDYLAGWMSADEKLTRNGNVFEKIALLPAGHCLTVDRAGARLRRWWKRPAAGAAPATPGETLRELLETAVCDRMRGASKVGLQLSGGLDSSTIACIAARRLKARGQRLTAFASVLPDRWNGPEADEREHIQAVLAQEDNIDIEWVVVPPEHSIFEGLEDRFAHLGAPLFAGNGHIETRLAERARACGVDVLLSGFGGDFFASFRGSVALALLLSGQILRAGRELAATRRRSGSSWSGVIRGELIRPLLPVLGWQSQRGSVPGPVLRAFLAREKARLHRERRGTFYALTPRERMLALLEPVHSETVLNNMIGYTERAFGLSLRYPMMDRRIVEFMVSLPPDELQRDGVQRAIFRAATAGILPETVRRREDKGAAFDPLLSARLIANRKGLTDWADASRGRRCWEFVDRDAFLRMLEGIRPGNRDSWTPELFLGVINGGILARYVDWMESGGFFDG